MLSWRAFQAFSAWSCIFKKLGEEERKRCTLLFLAGGAPCSFLPSCQNLWEGSNGLARGGSAYSSSLLKRSLALVSGLGVDWAEGTSSQKKWKIPSLRTDLLMFLSQMWSERLTAGGKLSCALMDFPKSQSLSLIWECIEDMLKAKSDLDFTLKAACYLEQGLKGCLLDKSPV